ncbi:p-hydroxybenzoic acid efflux pump subunit AaeB [Klebsiella quasipneumoniae]|uniref:FUSC family protein n=1 Tax=Klebsiella quasipneumoniae TaxID=1463165 RepID=UPI000E2BA97F|nr:FUSC family protein [Klebsiella quasipneumoniae]HBR1356323.1 FUSC family protein [Klebsiella quasipneumoniae subsp. quasipneumoniae]MEB6596475.1 FUSC family protein [Klebsiella quasipneumoniae]UKK44505.1 FUSC family protein [Klebsiella quasipneumoniae]SNQ39990.1 p-hydroxybenzoic acid efflux pump subunit AaeB [Klebsiella quasipneumoniae]VVJ45509.1 p-hydroxybenzoic acid efflux pump subunit AaeB [Klebsiella quasipneumoniae]
MNIILFRQARWLRAAGAVARRFMPQTPSAALRSDGQAVIYAAKSFAAAMLAYYLALSIGLQRPSWAIITVYIVSQTSAGASLSRSVYRLVGTVVGAAATVIIVPTFVNQPILCSVVLALWIAGSLCLSLLERTPRGYAFLLAGYTASLIGFPAVSAPGTIFDLAVTRVEEIAIGILCAGLIHRFVLPVRIAGRFNSTLAQTLATARQRIADTLAGKPVAAETLRLALSLQFLQGINHHLPWDDGLSVPHRQARKAIHDRLARLLIVNGELYDRLQRSGPPPDDLQALLAEAEAWLTGPQAARSAPSADGLLSRCERLIVRYAADAQTMDEALRLSLARHLAEAIRLLQESERLAKAVYRRRSPALPPDAGAAKGYVFHRDPLSALRTSFGAFVIILSGCLIWIGSAWPDGGTAVSILGVCCSLFASFDAPAAHLVKYLIGCVWGVLFSLLYSFVLLPQVNEFALLAAVLAPVYLLAGSLQARPATTFMAMGITLTLPILCELGASYRGDFATAINTALALFIAVGYAAFGMRLLQTVQAETAIRRLLTLCQRDIRRAARGRLAHNAHRWTNLMIDRTALLLPRLPQSGPAAGQLLDTMLRDIRTGLAVIHLRRRYQQADSASADAVQALLDALNPQPDITALEQPVNALLAQALPATDAASRERAEALIALYCALHLPEESQNHA